MRIIAGLHRGRKLRPPPDDSTRPITDRVKQSVFDILSPYIQEAEVWDVFAGTGSMGLECLSRGASKAVFFEAGRPALIELKKNIADLKLDAQCEVSPGDLYAAIPKRPPQSKATLCFLDPPYRHLKDESDKLLDLAQALAQQLHPEAIIIFRHDAADKLALPPWQQADVREYGSMTVEFLRRS